MPPHAAGFHSTPTLDYGIVISGSVELVSANNHTTLSAGDISVVRAANHTWRNPSNSTPCVMVFVLVSSKHPDGVD